LFSVNRSIFIKWKQLKRRLSPKKYWLNTQHGFTLLELVFVMILMGILSSMAVAKYSSLQYQSSDITIKWAVNHLNEEVREIFEKNKMADDSTGPYQGYTGDLGPDIIITGQAPDTPKSGTIRLASDSDIYEITWTPGAKENTKSHGHFKLGQIL
jgi:prepilin-type N-terminal cleavage/methylation domain-containing protein